MKTNSPRKTDQLLALLGKEMKQIVRDPSTWLIALVLPLIFLFFFGFAISFDADNLRLAIVNQSRGGYAQSLELDFTHSPHFVIHPARTRHESTLLMTDSVVQGVLVIPEDFDSAIQRGSRPDLQLMVDGAEPNTANFIQAYANGLVTNWSVQSAFERGVTMRSPIWLEPIYWYNNAAKSRWSLIPGSITIVMTLIGTLLTSLVITREWERGTMEALFASPVSRKQIFLSKLLPYYLLAMFSMFMCALAGVWLFQVPFRGSVLALILLSTAFLMAALGQGLMISSLFRSQFPAAMAGFLSSVLPAFILSGLLFDINSMPLAIRLVTRIIPARYLNTSMQTLFLAGNVWPLFLECMAWMAGLGLLFFIRTYRNLVKRLD